MTAPSLSDLMARAAAALVDGMHITLPAIVVAYDETRQCVDAQPTITREIVGEGAVEIERLPVVTRAPVVFPGSGPYRITWPVEVGSVVVLHFTSAAMGRWLSLGGGDVESRDGRRHHPSSAFAIPGGHSFAGPTSPGTAAPTDALVIHAPAGGLVRAGGPSADQPPAFNADLAALIAAYNTHTHTDPASGITGPPSVTRPAPTGAVKVRVE